MADSRDGTAAKAYGLTAYPYFVLVNADGTVAGRGSGELPEDQTQGQHQGAEGGRRAADQLVEQEQQRE